MRAALSKVLVRERSAYRLGRAIVDGLLIGQVVVAVLAVVGVFIYESRRQGEDIYLIAAVLCGAFLLAIVAILQRELLQALFDVADRVLTGGQPPENLFTTQS